MKLRITIEGVTYEVDVEVVDEGTGAGLPPAAQAAAAHQAAAHLRPVAPPAAAPAPTPAPAPAAAPAAAGGGGQVVKAPIAGTVLDIRVKPGDVVALNQTVLVMEAMKMETSVASTVEGTVKAILVAPGAAVRQGQPLVEFA